MARRLLIAVVGAAGVTGCSLLDALSPPTLPEYKTPTEVLWLNQNWSNDARFWFHHTPQGTATIPIPYDWFLALEQSRLFAAGDIPLFSDPEHLARFGFIPSPKGATFAKAENVASQGFSESRAGSHTVAYGSEKYRGNPGGLPVGFALTLDQLDPVTGSPLGPRLGFTCAACHTGQFTYRGVNIRIDGGPAVTNLDAFTKALGVALAYTRLIPWRFSRFADRVLGEGHTEAEKARLLEAFKHTVDELARKAEAESASQGDRNVEEGFARLDALNRIGNQVFFERFWGHELDGFDPARNIAPTDAPVNYPHIWSTSWFDWVQYDASIMQPMVRNAGESLGVVARLNIVTADRLYDSTVLVDELFWMEDLLAGKDPIPVRRFRGLRAPAWPEDVLGEIDRAKAERGERLYRRFCQECHLPPVSSDEFWSDAYWRPLPGAEGRYLKLMVKSLDEIGTDPAQARVLADRQIDLPELLAVPAPKAEEESPGGAICRGEPGTVTTRTGFAWALAYVTEAAIGNRFDAKTPPTPPERRWAMSGERPNCVRAPLGYKARPLNGIWATAPFLHNGSVLTLHDMLMPAAERPKTICLGDLEFDPVKVGYAGACADGTTRIDTTKPGNLSAGHSFEEGNGVGVIGPELSAEQRMELIEFLKTQ